MAKKERKEKKEKPLDKMTATELRKYALDLGEISGVHGMNKEELLSAIKQVKGIKDEGQAHREGQHAGLEGKSRGNAGPETGSHRRQGTPGEDRHPAQEGQPHEEADPQGGLTWGEAMAGAAGRSRPRLRRWGMFSIIKGWDSSSPLRRTTRTSSRIDWRAGDRLRRQSAGAFFIK